MERLPCARSESPEVDLQRRARPSGQSDDLESCDAGRDVNFLVLCCDAEAGHSSQLHSPHILLLHWCAAQKAVQKVHGQSQRWKCEVELVTGLRNRKSKESNNLLQVSEES